MNTNLLKKHINDFLRKYKNHPKKFVDDLQERKELIMIQGTVLCFFLKGILDYS
jgi:hypothetical protein